MMPTIKPYESNTNRFDLIYVDGDHRFDFALHDLESSWKSLNPGGLLIFDDYGNSDTPDVTKAAKRFYRNHWDEIEFGVIFGSMFRNSHKAFPVVSFQVGLLKNQV